MLLGVSGVVWLLNREIVVTNEIMPSSTPPGGGEPEAPLQATPRHALARQTVE